MKSFNIRYPLRDNVVTNTLFQMSQITKDAFSSDLLLLLLTEKGQRYYEPDYGTDLLKYIFEPNDNLTASDIEQEIKNTVSLYIPSLSISGVEFKWNTDDEGNVIGDNQLNVLVSFVYSEDAFSEQGSIELTF
jgi:phage baseplate assembly protein W